MTIVNPRKVRYNGATSKILPSTYSLNKEKTEKPEIVIRTSMKKYPKKLVNLRSYEKNIK
jgi:hypothetical protein